MVGVLKIAVLRYVIGDVTLLMFLIHLCFIIRLAVLASVIIGAFFFSTIIYVCIYYFVIPVAVQESPLHFKL